MAEVLILINTETGFEIIEDVYEKVKELREVELAAMLLGPYDIVAWAKAENFRDIKEVLLKEIRNIDGVKNTLTNTVVEVSKKKEIEL